MNIYAQETAIITGNIQDTNGNVISYANIKLKGSTIGTTSNIKGDFKLLVPIRKSYTIQISYIGYKAKEIQIAFSELNNGKTIYLKPSLNEISEVSVTGTNNQMSNLIKIEKKAIERLPNMSGNIETVIKSMPGVASNNELSSQYSVRGGSFDENLIYVNDIQVYRPFLIRAGKQEGLSFVNSDMVSSIKFSAGGFAAQYGDKMSSVLDIKYNKPTEFSGKVSMSMLGASVHFEDAINGKLTYNTGFRYKTSKYILNSLDVEGNYNPEFYDLQTFITYKVNTKLRIEVLGNYGLNKYNFTPQNRETTFGTVQDALSLNIYYDGNELDKFETYLGSISANYVPNEKLSLKFIASSFNTQEAETYDILGQYYLNELDKSMSSDTYGDSIMNIGVGSFLNHARNYLTANVHSFSHKGGYYTRNNKLQWGIKYNYESIDDKIREWDMVDSAGYSLPYNNTDISLYNSSRANNLIKSNRITAFVQNTFHRSYINSDIYYNTGIRFHYWDFNNEIDISPRVSILIEPKIHNNIKFRLATGYYYQPPFYKEIKNPEGVINRNIKSQRSIHFVFGTDYIFKAWDRPFKFTTELYYKTFSNLIPYKIDNVRIQYSAENKAKGYATGIDMKLNGEFVKGIESWASLSIMRTREDILNDQYTNSEGEIIKPGYYPRPTDQLLNFSMYFQDYIPNNPSYKMNLSLHYGSRLPFSAPNTDRYDLTYKMPPYRRVDIGFSKILIDKDSDFNKNNLLKHFKSAWVSLEIFNLLDINNTISYLWIKTLQNQEGESGQYAVPNYLTSRRINIKLTAKF
ncbi:MAG: carboxypeptidase-like regulatory domain-containing protein [Bacteroidales bacterium]|nr:carboxypeptidase-like regulatory domain-containing protein [Bacteroidales bacterium]